VQPTNGNRKGTAVLGNDAGETASPDEPVSPLGGLLATSAPSSLPTKPTKWRRRCSPGVLSGQHGRTATAREPHRHRCLRQGHLRRGAIHAARRAAGTLAEAQLKARIARSEGDGEASRLLAEAFGRDLKFFAFYRAMESYRHALAESAPTLVLSPESELLRYFNTGAIPAAKS